MPLKLHHSLSLSLPFSRDSAIGVVHGLSVSPPYAHRRTAGLPVLLVLLLVLDQSPEVVISIVRVRLPAWRSSSSRP